MFVSLDLLGPKEIIISFEQKLSKYFVDPYKIVPWHKSCSIKRVKKWSISFFALEIVTFFSKTSVLNNLLGPKRMPLYII